MVPCLQRPRELVEVTHRVIVFKAAFILIIATAPSGTNQISLIQTVMRTETMCASVRKTLLVKTGAAALTMALQADWL